MSSAALKEYVLLCEGGGDVAFFEHLIKSRKLPDFSVISPRWGTDNGGVSGYEGRLRALKVQPTFEVVKGLLVVGDNDGDPSSAFGGVKAQIEAAGDFNLPKTPLTVAKGKPQSPIVVVMMLPWTDEIGQLETLCLIAMRDTYPELAKCVDQFCQCSGTAEWRRNKLEKMTTRAMLTANCEQDPNTSLSYAWSRSTDLIPLTHTCFDRIANFLDDFPALASNGA